MVLFSPVPSIKEVGTFTYNLQNFHSNHVFQHAKSPITRTERAFFEMYSKSPYRVEGDSTEGVECLEDFPHAPNGYNELGLTWARKPNPC